MDIVGSLVVAWVVFAAGMLAAWAVERRTGNAGWVDVVWTVSLALAALAGTVTAIALGASFDAGRIGAAGLLLFAWTARLGVIWRRARLASATTPDTPSSGRNGDPRPGYAWASCCRPKPF